MKKRDCILILTLLASSVLSMLILRSGPTGGTAYIYKGNTLYGTFDLSEDRIINITNDNGIHNEIEIADGSVFMRDASCPNKLCVRSGRISRNNESICCAPAGILIVVRSDTNGDYDAVTK